MSELNRHHKTLELPRILSMLSELTGCPGTKELALSLRPACDCREASLLLGQTNDASLLSGKYGSPSIYGLIPCVPLLERARVGSMLSMKELLSVALLLKTARTLKAWRRLGGGEEGYSLDGFFAQLMPDKSLEDEITNAIISEDEISDHASPELYDIRRKMRGAGQKARELLDRMIRSATYQKYLQEQIITIRNGRFVVPVRAEYRGEIQGLVHDTSSSGATVFVEPMAVVEQNNLIRELEGKEQSEITRILLAFTGRVGEQAEEQIQSYRAMLELDLIFAKSRLADKMRATLPILAEEGETCLKKARHPLIPGEKVVPIDIILGGEFDTLVITGPNTGGKTVALKTLGLLTIMASCGLMIPAAEESRVRYYNTVLSDIGDEQSIEQSLSTFSSHMTNIVSILSQADSGSLVLIDELGAGTDPVEGAALAVSILTQLRNQGAKTAATTHYAEIKVFALETPGVENASCEFDISSLRPTYRLLIGVPGRSNAFAISERLGLSADIIEAAKKGVSRENTRFEDVVGALEESRRQLEEERAQISRYRKEAEEAKQAAEKLKESLNAQSELELRKAREEAKSLVEQVRFQSERLLKELDELKRQKEKDDFASTVSDIRTTFKSYLNDLEDLTDPVVRQKEADRDYRLPRALRTGDTVRLIELGSEGTVIAPADQQGFVEIRAGILKTRIHQSGLRLIEKEKATKNGGSVDLRSAVKSAKQEASASVDLRGMTSDEALLDLDRYIDGAVLSGIPTVTIIHGKGTGALRKAVGQHLKSHKSVKAYRAGVYGEGEAGVTIAELK